MKEILLQKSNFRCRENIYICRPLRRLRRLAVEYVKKYRPPHQVRKFYHKRPKHRVTSRCVRRSVMSASKFHRSVVSACGHNGTTGTSRCVRCSVMSAMDFHRSVVSACGHNGTTGTSRCVRRSVMSANKFYRSVVSACVYIHICRNYFQLTLCELIIIK